MTSVNPERLCGLENSASKEPPLTIVMGNRCKTASKRLLKIPDASCWQDQRSCANNKKQQNLPALILPEAEFAPEKKLPTGTVFPTATFSEFAQQLGLLSLPVTRRSEP